MASPRNIFANQDYISLEADDNENLKAIQAFHPSDGKLVLELGENFDGQTLWKVSEALSYKFKTWKLMSVWYAWPLYTIFSRFA